MKQRLSADIRTIGVVKSIDETGTITICYPYSSKDSALHDAIETAKTHKTLVTFAWGEWLRVIVSPRSSFPVIFNQLKRWHRSQKTTIGP